MGGIAIVNLTSEKIVEGNDIPITWDVTEDGDYYDWTGVTKMWFCIKETVHDDDADALVLLNSVDDSGQVKYDHPTADEGQCWVELASTDSAGLAAKGTLKYEIKVLKSGKENTLIQGDICFRHGRIEANS